MHRRLLSPRVRLFLVASVLDVLLLLLAHFYPLYKGSATDIFRAGRLGRCSPCLMLIALNLCAHGVPRERSLPRSL